jgi:hypothetical protein
MSGPYGFVMKGTIFGRGLVAGVGVITFDGKGNWALDSTTVSEDMGVQHITNPAGTYKVNAACTGSAALQGSQGLATFDFVIIDGGKEILQIATQEAPRRVVTWVLKKQFPQQQANAEN